MAWRHFVTDWRVWRDIKACFAWTDWAADIGENFMVEKQSKKFIVHFCFHFKAYIPVYPAYLWSLRWVYAVKKTRRLVYGVYPRIPPNTPLVAMTRVRLKNRLSMRSDSVSLRGILFLSVAVSTIERQSSRETAFFLANLSTACSSYFTFQDWKCG